MNMNKIFWYPMGFLNNSNQKLGHPKGFLNNSNQKLGHQKGFLARPVKKNTQDQLETRSDNNFAEEGTRSVAAELYVYIRYLLLGIREGLQNPSDSPIKKVLEMQLTKQL